MTQVAHRRLELLDLVAQHGDQLLLRVALDDGLVADRPRRARVVEGAHRLFGLWRAVSIRRPLAEHNGQRKRGGPGKQRPASKGQQAKASKQRPASKGQQGGQQGGEETDVEVGRRIEVS